MVRGTFLHILSHSTCVPLLIIFSVLTIAWATQRLVKLMYYFNVISGMCVICIYDVFSSGRVYTIRYSDLRQAYFDMPAELPGLPEEFQVIFT